MIDLILPATALLLRDRHAVEQPLHGAQPEPQQDERECQPSGVEAATAPGGMLAHDVAQADRSMDRSGDHEGCVEGVPGERSARTR
jgi:hypothetical protein